MWYLEEGAETRFQKNRAFLSEQARAVRAPGAPAACGAKGHLLHQRSRPRAVKTTLPPHIFSTRGGKETGLVMEGGCTRGVLRAPAGLGF